MARRESKALAGFFPTPAHLLPSIAAMLRPEWSADAGQSVVLVDPCAGEGSALVAIRDGLKHGPCANVDTFACEMERGRWEKLRASDPKRQWSHHAGQHLCGDFFHVQFSPGLADCLYLNPPYDQDRDYRRLEARWLHHAAPMLAVGGVLVFVVPHYCLSACAAAMALHFEDVRCFRFPDDDFGTFKQVVVLGRKVLRAAQDPAVSALCQGWSEDVSGTPELPDADHAASYPVRSRSKGGYGVIHVERDDWRMMGFDVSGVATLAPWYSERGALRDLDHPTDLCDRIGAVYPVVSPPRPVHLAAALSAGVFNGLHVAPNPGHPLPGLLVKGTFARKWETVEVKTNKDGAATGEVQVERPVLDVWALDLDAGTYHQLRSSAEITGAASVADFTFADLLDRYSSSLLAALRAACPVLHDPGRDPEPPVEELGRPLWPAQTTTLHAVHKLLDQPGQGALIVGEVGTGKTSIALALAKVRDARRSLVICPPHLLQSWSAQTRTVRPDADVVVLDSLSDVDALRGHPGPVVALLSRETAKLGHGWRSVEPVLRRPLPTCPACGALVMGERHAERRVRCEGGTLAARGPLARWVLRHRWLLLRCDPQNVSLGSLVPPTAQGQRWLTWAQKHSAGEREQIRLTAALAELYTLLSDQPALAEALLPVIAWARPSTALDGLHVFPAYNRETKQGREWMTTRIRIAFACDVRPDLGAHPDESDGWTYGHTGPLAGQRYGVKTADQCWSEFRGCWEYLHGQYTPRRDQFGNMRQTPDGMYQHGPGHKGDGPGYAITGTTPTLQGNERGSDKALSYALTRIVLAAAVRAVPCGEPLFHSVPEPRRYPLGTYIARHAADVFDMLVIDEVHEYAAETSAQGIVAARLAQMANRRGIPVVYMTGSLVNGYADSAFHALRAVSPAFRASFGHRDRERFGDTYGLRKRVLVYESPSKGGLVRGAQSERILSGVKKAGMAPGVLPVLLLHHLLANAAIIHKADLEIGLPPQSEETVHIDLDPVVAANLDHLIEAVKHAISATRFQAGCAGKLFGVITKLLSYPDLAACGDYEARWPENVPTLSVRDVEVSPGGLIARVPGTDPTVLLPKERWFLDSVRDELDAGRGVLALPAHVQLLDRLAWVLDQAGIEATVLRSEKVPPHKREAWIDRHLNRRSRRVLVTNPVCVQTGLNNLVSLATSLWYENPECKPLVYRQANGRLHRPGQELPVRSVFPLYQHALPVNGHKLLMHKVGVSLAVDGLDPDAVLEAAGVASEFSAGLNVGQQLYRMLVGQAGE